VDRDANERNFAAMTTLHFAYGANMSRAVMQKYARRPRARRGSAGRSSLRHHRRRLCSVEPARGQTVHGVLWRITPRDRVMLDAWENVGGGLYRAEIWRCAGSAVLRRPWCIRAARRRRAAEARLYRARSGGGAGMDLPEAYIHWLEGFASARPLGPDARKIGEFR
jgi:hypothetical protein